MCRNIFIWLGCCVLCTQQYSGARCFIVVAMQWQALLWKCILLNWAIQCMFRGFFLCRLSGYRSYSAIRFWFRIKLYAFILFILFMLRFVVILPVDRNLIEHKPTTIMALCSWFLSKCQFSVYLLSSACCLDQEAYACMEYTNPMYFQDILLFC